VVENADEFKKSDEEQPMMFMGMPISQRQQGEGSFRKYRVNVLVDNGGLTGAPVVTESNPALQTSWAGSSIKLSSGRCSPTST